MFSYNSESTLVKNPFSSESSVVYKIPLEVTSGSSFPLVHRGKATFHACFPKGSSSTQDASQRLKGDDLCSWNHSACGNE